MEKKKVIIIAAIVIGSIIGFILIKAAVDPNQTVIEMVGPDPKQG